MKNFVVAISRENGSRGRELGKMIAKTLGVSYYDKELLRFASEESGISEELFEKYEEKYSLLYRIAKKVYSGEIIPPGRVDFLSGDNLFNYQAKVAKKLAEEESFVLIGQCGGFVLGDMPNLNLIRVFVTAKKEDRIKSLEEKFHLSIKDLEKLIERTDKHRAGYFQYHTGEKWRDIRNYDICIDTSKITLEQGVELVKNFIKIKKEI